MSDRPDPYQSTDNQPSPTVSKHVIDEERETLSRQYEMMQHIDDRALRITRTSAVLLGITFTGLSILVRPSSESAKLIAPNIPFWAMLTSSGGVLLLTSSLIVGIVTTQYSRPIYGIGERVRHDISARRSTRRALVEMSNEYDDGISVMQSRLERNRRLLWAVQIIFIFGLIFLIIGSSLVLSDAVEVSAGASNTEVGLVRSTVTSIRDAPVP